MVNLKNETTHQVKQCKLGWSWTVFFFGFWPMLFRQDWIYLICYAAWDVIGSAIAYSSDGAFSVIASADFIIRIVLAVMYNALYVKGLLKKGWKPADKTSKRWQKASCWLNQLRTNQKVPKSLLKRLKIKMLTSSYENKHPRIGGAFYFLKIKSSP